MGFFFCFCGCCYCITFFTIDYQFTTCCTCAIFLDDFAAVAKFSSCPIFQGARLAEPHTIESMDAVGELELSASHFWLEGEGVTALGMEGRRDEAGHLHFHYLSTGAEVPTGLSEKFNWTDNHPDKQEFCVGIKVAVFSHAVHSFVFTNITSSAAERAIRERPLRRGELRPRLRPLPRHDPPPPRLRLRGSPRLHRRRPFRSVGGRRAQPGLRLPLLALRHPRRLRHLGSPSRVDGGFAQQGLLVRHRHFHRHPGATRVGSVSGTIATLLTPQSWPIY